MHANINLIHYKQLLKGLGHTSLVNHVADKSVSIIVRWKHELVACNGPI